MKLFKSENTYMCLNICALRVSIQTLLRKNVSFLPRVTPIGSHGAINIKRLRRNITKYLSISEYFDAVAL